MSQLMDVMVAGAVGGREHALGLALHDEAVDQLTFTHGGNAGTRDLGINLTITDNGEIADYAENSEQDLVIVGPEAPLIAGLGDMLRERGILVFGPGREGAKLEGSKAFATEFMEEFGIPHPESVIAHNLTQAIDYVYSHAATKYVIKADGEAGGKGVILPKSQAEAGQVVIDMMNGKLFKEAGKTIVFQKRLNSAGPEVSAFLVSDGKNFTVLPLSQDHKRLKDGDKGPNTGGMGAYTPIPFGSEKLYAQVMNIGHQTMEGLEERGIDFRGLIYLGGMVDIEDDDTLKILEFNVRFGDPESQVVLAMLKESGVNLTDLLHSAARGRLDEAYKGQIIGQAAGKAALTVCLAADGYPKSPVKGDIITGLDRIYEGVTVHHGGTRFDQDIQQIVTNGGRVLYITAIGETADEAARRAYAAIGEDGVYFDGMQFREDIAWQARQAA